LIIEEFIMVITDTVNKQVYEIIKAMILERKLKPGERIDTKRIAAENGVSMMPVRNALHQLTTQGLVVTVQRVGFFVRRFSNIELQQINDMRKMFELYCIQNYFDSINRQEAKQILEQLKETSPDNEKALQTLDMKLHRIIVAASDNTFLMKQYDHLHCLFSLGIGPFSAETPEVAKEEHMSILDAICSNDYDRAYRGLLEHLDRVGREIIEHNNSLGGNAV
jgi:DNA-binding GntR family transcriptional regulator